jgi:multiple sugar transport system permease protein
LPAPFAKYYPAKQRSGYNDLHQETGVESVKNTRVGYVFIGPYVVGILTFSVFPVFYNVYLALTNKEFINVPEFVGLQNFIEMFADGFFISALRTTIFYAIPATLFLVLVPLSVALLVHGNLPGKGYFRTMYFTPIIMSAPAIAAVFIFIYDKDFGLLNQWLGLLGQVAWIGNKNYSILSLIILAIWHHTPINFILYVAALEDVPTDLVEAAIIDGAPYHRRLLNVILPYITPTIFLTMVTTTTFQMKQFAYPAILNEGRYGTATLAYYVYEVGFLQTRFGYASAIALFFSLMIFVFMLVQWSLRKRWVLQ